MFELHFLEAVDEASLSRVEQHWNLNGFAALTAWRADVDDSINRKNLTALKALVAVAGYGWVQVMGSWSEQGGKPKYEPSLVIPAMRRDSGRDEASLSRDSRDLRKLAIEWGIRYGQWGILWTTQDGKGQVITTSPKLSGHPNGYVSDTFTAFKPGNTRADIRTIISRAAHKRIAQGKGPVGHDDPGATFHLECYLDPRPMLPTEALVRRALGELGISPLWEGG